MDIIKYLDKLLEIDKYDDYSNNGLQIEKKGDINRIVFGVDISIELIDFAVEKKADLIIIHHGLSWSNSMKYITGRNYIITKRLMDNNIALYAAHAPLDAHRKLGNNVELARVLGVSKLRPFGHDHGITWGYWGIAGKDFMKRVRKLFDAREFLWKKTNNRIGIVSGGGGFAVHEAYEKGIGTLFTGETSHQSVVEAKDLGVNIIFGGHYRTETYGVLALKRHLEKKFKTFFGEFDTGL